MLKEKRNKKISISSKLVDENNENNEIMKIMKILFLFVEA